MAVGRALAPLRQAGIMLVGTGSTVCNPHRLSPSNGDSLVESWALAFDDWVSERLADLDVAGQVEFADLIGLAVEALEAAQQLGRLASGPQDQAVRLHVEHVELLDIADGQDDAACYHVGLLAVQLDHLAVERGR